MKQFKVILDLDNSAFGKDPGKEVARILRRLAKSMETGLGEGECPIYDINGNRVGSFEVSGQDEGED